MHSRDTLSRGDLFPGELIFLLHWSICDRPCTIPTSELDSLLLNVLRVEQHWRTIHYGYTFLINSAYYSRAVPYQDGTSTLVSTYLWHSFMMFSWQLFSYHTHLLDTEKRLMFLLWGNLQFTKCQLCAAACFIPKCLHKSLLTIWHN